MDLKIYKSKAEFNESCLGNQKDLLFVEFPNCISTKTNKPFKWLPTHKQVEELKIALDDIEKVWKEKNGN